MLNQYQLFSNESRLVGETCGYLLCSQMMMMVMIHNKYSSPYGGELSQKSANILF